MVKIVDDKLSPDRKIWSMKRTEHVETTFCSFNGTEKWKKKLKKQN